MIRSIRHPLAFLGFVAVAAATALGVRFASERPKSKTWSGKVVRVTDADTIVVFDSRAKREVKIRLAGIDAPEKKQEFGGAAREALVAKVTRQSVTVRPTGRDRYGRTIGEIELDGGASERGESINAWLVREGWAWHYVAYSDSEELAAAEQEARAAKRGLWAGANPVPPWDWRAAKTPAAPADDGKR